MKGGVITTSSGVSARTGKGFVTLHWEDQVAQFSLDEARTFGLTILAVTAAAEQDAGMIAALFDGKVTQEAAGLLTLMRKNRGDERWSLKSETHVDEPED